MKIHAGLLTHHPMGDVASVRRLLEPLTELPKDWQPTKFGRYEPPGEPFDLERLGEVWDWLLLWEAPRAEGTLTRKHRPEQLSYVDVEASTTDASLGDRLVAYLVEAVNVVGAVFGYVHVLTPKDREWGLYSGAVRGDGLVVSEHTLGQFVPDLYWVTILGPEYSKFFERDRILSAPVTVAEIGEETYLMRLSQHLSDVIRDPEGFEQTRAAAKAHLGEDAFFDPGRQAFRVPPTLVVTQPAQSDPQVGNDDLLTDEMTHLAETFVKVGREDGYALDYSEASIAALDAIIDELFADPDDAEGRVDERFHQTMAPVIAAYLGCAIVRNLNGRWVHGPQGRLAVVIGDELWTYPIENVERRFAYGHSDSLGFYYDTVRDLGG